MGSKHIFFGFCVLLASFLVLFSPIGFFFSFSFLFFFLLDFTQNSTLPVLSISPFSFCATHTPKHSQFLSPTLASSSLLVYIPLPLSHTFTTTLFTRSQAGGKERDQKTDL